MECAPACLVRAILRVWSDEWEDREDQAKEFRLGPRSPGGKGGGNPGQKRSGLSREW